MKNGIFISYRRQDADGFARSLFQSLTAYFGTDQVFMDVEDIELGLDFVDAIDKSLSSCGVLLVLIGKEWLNCVDEDGQPRLDNPEDFVRMEVATALRRNIRVIPVCVRGATMPKSEQLPEDLQLLTRRQALELHHDRWNADIEKLITALENTLGIKPKPKPGQAPIEPPNPEQPVPHKTDTKPIAKNGGRKLQLIGVIVAIPLIIAAINFILTEEPGPEETVYEPYDSQNSPVDIKPSPELIDSAITEFGYKEPRFRPTPEPDPEPDHRMIEEAQELLTEMGYNPGPIDGQMGGMTHRAIQTFQRDLGLDPDGQVSEQLIGVMTEVFTSQQQTAAGSVRKAPQALPNLSGRWYDQDGIQYTIEQEGDYVTYQATIPLLGTIAGRGRGHLSGRSLEYTFEEADGSQGNGRGFVSEDGRQIEYAATYLGTGQQDAGVLHKEPMSR